MIVISHYNWPLLIIIIKSVWPFLHIIETIHKPSFINNFQPPSTIHQPYHQSTSNEPSLMDQQIIINEPPTIQASTIDHPIIVGSWTIQPISFPIPSRNPSGYSTSVIQGTAPFHGSRRHRRELSSTIHLTIHQPSVEKTFSWLFDHHFTMKKTLNQSSSLPIIIRYWRWLITIILNY